MLKIVALIVLITVVGFIGVTAWKVEQRKAQVAKNFPPDGKFVTVNGHPVHYVEMGSGPDLVLLHGASGNIRDFTFSLAQKLAETYHVIIFDRPGLGHTPALASSGVTLTDQAALLSQAAWQLGAKKPIVAGQSFGGAVAMAWAVNHPDRIAAVVSMAGATYPWTGPEHAYSARLKHPIKGPIVARLIAAWASPEYVADSIQSVFAPQKAPAGYADHIGIPMILTPQSLIANAQQRLELRQHLQELHSHYPALTLPIEIVHGDTDATVAVEIHSARMIEDVKSANMVVLPGIGHMPQHVSQPETIAAIQRAAKRAGLR